MVHSWLLIVDGLRGLRTRRSRWKVQVALRDKIKVTQEYGDGEYSEHVGLLTETPLNFQKEYVCRLKQLTLPTCANYCAEPEGKV